jgi:hypothetical protein
MVFIHRGRAGDDMIQNILEVPVSETRRIRTGLNMAVFTRR